MLPTCFLQFNVISLYNRPSSIDFELGGPEVHRCDREIGHGAVNGIPFSVPLPSLEIGTFSDNFQSLCQTPAPRAKIISR